MDSFKPKIAEREEINIEKINTDLKVVLKSNAQIAGVTSIPITNIDPTISKNKTVTTEIKQTKA